MSERYAAVVDVETTGFTLPAAAAVDQQPRCIEFACVVLRCSDAAEVRRFHTLINPGVSISAEISKVTGLKDEDLVDAPRIAQALPQIAEALVGCHGFFAHNATFDRDVLWWEAQRLGAERAFPWPPKQLCTVQLYVAEYGKRLKLTELYAHKLGRPLDQKHRAMSDVEALVEIVRKEELTALV